MFSVVNPTSFENVLLKWLPEVRHHMPHTPILLCGSKIDLRNDKEVIKKLHAKGFNTISKEEGELMAKECGFVGYLENSSITNSGIAETFNAVVCTGGLYEATAEELKKYKKKSTCKSQ